jgi:hypothetical protein
MYPIRFYNICLYFFLVRSHPCGASNKIAPSVCTHVTIPEWLNGFSIHLTLGSLTKKSSSHLNFGSDWTTITGTLLENLFAFMCAEVTEYGITSRKSPAMHKGQRPILANAA